MNILKITLFAAAALLLTACNNTRTQPETKTVSHESTTEKQINPDAVLATANFEIEGMQCAIGCAKVIEKKLAQAAGVQSATVDFDSKTATVTFDTDTQDRDRLSAIVTQAGGAYSVTTWEQE